VSPPVQPEIATALLSPTQVLANAHQLRAIHGWSQADTDQYVQEQTGQPTMTDLATSLSDYAVSPEAPSGGAAFATGVGRGASIGFADRLSGAVDAFLEGAKQRAVSGGLYDPSGIADAYSRGRDEARQYYAAADQAHPVLSTLGKVTGGIASAAIPIGSVAKAGTLAQAGLRGAATGAGFGVAGGLASSSDLFTTDALKRAGVEGLIGGGLGFGLGAAGEWLARRLSGVGLAAQQLGKYTNPAVMAQTEGALDRAGRLSQAVPADLSPETQALGDAAINAAPADVRAQLQGAIAARNQGQPQRLAQDLEDLYGQTLNGPKRIADLRAVVQQIERDPVLGYEALDRATGPITDPRLLEFMQRPKIASLYQGVLDQLGMAGTEQPTQGLSFTALNGLRRTLKDAASAAYAHGGAGGFTGAAYSQAAQDLGGILADNVPGFEELQHAVGHHLNLIETAENALETLEEKTPAALAESMNQMSPDQLQEFRYALASKLRDQFVSMRTSQDATKRILEDPNLRARLEAVFGDDQTFQRFLGQVNAERIFRQTGNTFGSQTAQRLNTAEAFGETGGPSLGLTASPQGVHPFLFLHPPGVPRSETAAAMAKALYTPGTLSDFLDRLRGLQAAGNAYRIAPTSLVGGGAALGPGSP